MSAPAAPGDRRLCQSPGAASLSTEPSGRAGRMTVVGVLAEARVRDRHEGQHGLADPAQRVLDDAVVGRRFRAVGVLASGRPNRRTPPTPSPARRRASSSASSRDSRESPGIEATGSRSPDPGSTNSGATSIDGWTRVSRTRLPSAAVRRSRRGRTDDPALRTAAAEAAGSSSPTVMRSPGAAD